jgi:hypothetical protein
MSLFASLQQAASANPVIQAPPSRPRRKLRLYQWIQRMTVPVYAAFVDGREPAIVDIAAEIGVDYRFIRTVCGKGSENRLGLRLWCWEHGTQRRIQACRQNVFILHDFLTMAGTRELCERMSMGERAIERRLLELRWADDHDDDYRSLTVHVGFEGADFGYDEANLGQPGLAKLVAQARQAAPKKMVKRATRKAAPKKIPKTRKTNSRRKAGA